MCICVLSVYENVHMWAQEPMGPEESLDHLQLEFRQFDPLLWMLWTELRFLSESNKDPEPLSSLSRPWWSLPVMGYQKLLNLREFSNILACPPSSSGSTERKAHKQIKKEGSFSERLGPWGGLCVPVCPAALGACLLLFSCSAPSLSTHRKGHHFTVARWELKSWTCKLYHYNFKRGSNSLLFHFPL